MNKHFLNGPDNIDGKIINQLPDRSDLSKIYTNSDVNCRSDGDESFKKNYKPVNNHLLKNNLYLVVGALIPIPFAAIVVLYGYLNQNVGENINGVNSVFAQLPAIIISVVAIIGSTIVILKTIAAAVWRFGVSLLPFLGYIILCLAMVIQPLYLMITLFSNKTFGTVLYILATMILSAALSAIFIKVVKSDTRFKLIFLAVPFVVCLTIALTVSLVLSHHLLF